MPRARSRRFSSAPAASACSSPRICLGLRRVLVDGRLGEPELDGQGDQVLLGAVVDVAFQPPPRLVLRGDQPLPGRPQVLDQAGVRQHQAGLGGHVGDQLLPGRAQRLILGHLDRDRAQQLALVHDGDAQVGVGQRRHRSGHRRAARRRRTARLPPEEASGRSSSSTRSHTTTCSAPVPAATMLRHLRQHVLGRSRCRRCAGRSRTAPDTGWPAGRTRPGWPAARPTGGPAGTRPPPPRPPAPPAAGCRRSPASVPTPTTRPA